MSGSVPRTPVELAAAFSALSRQEKTPSGKMDNHWHICVRSVDIEPAGLVLLIVNPPSGYIHVEKMPLEGTSALAHPAQLYAPVTLCLMKSFVEGLAPDTKDPHQRPPAFAPWSLSMPADQEAVAKLVEKQLRALDVPKERRKIRLSTPDEDKTVEKVWDHFYSSLKNAVSVE